MFTPHPKLSRAPIREVLFEMHLSESVDSRTLAQALAEGFGDTQFRQSVKRTTLIDISKEDTSEILLQKLEQAQSSRQRTLISDDRHTRLSIASKKFSYGQRGDYKGWERYRQSVETALSIYANQSGANAYKSLSLYFANALFWADAGQEDVNLNGAGDILSEWLTAKSPESSIQQNILQIGLNFASKHDAGLQNLEVFYPALDESDKTYIHLKLEMVADFEEDQPFSVEEILEWMDIAHEGIYAAFTQSLSEKYMGEIT